MLPRLFVATACVAMLNALPAQAHHSFAAEFDGTKPVRLIGTITKIEWTNPHSYFKLGVKDSEGGDPQLRCRVRAIPGALSRRGWKKGAIKLGDALIVDGYLAKDGSRLIDGACAARSRTRRPSMRMHRWPGNRRCVAQLTLQPRRDSAPGPPGRSRPRSKPGPSFFGDNQPDHIRRRTIGTRHRDAGNTRESLEYILSSGHRHRWEQTDARFSAFGYSQLQT